MRILVASGNRRKLQELQQILAFPELDILGPAELATPLPDVVEDAPDFAGNALKKARSAWNASGLTSLADDSGLCVDALGGDPGVRSARYAGEPSNDAANNRKLLHNLEGVANRRAHFACVIALVGPDIELIAEGRCSGQILESQRGQGGFGYDPLFVPDGETRSFAELPAERKHAISHRGQALARLVELMREKALC